MKKQNQTYTAPSPVDEYFAHKLQRKEVWRRRREGFNENLKAAGIALGIFAGVAAAIAAGVFLIAALSGGFKYDEIKIRDQILKAESSRDPVLQNHKRSIDTMNARIEALERAKH